MQISWLFHGIKPGEMHRLNGSRKLYGITVYLTGARSRVSESLSRVKILGHPSH